VVLSFTKDTDAVPALLLIKKLPDAEAKSADVTLGPPNIVQYNLVLLIILVVDILNTKGEPSLILVATGVTSQVAPRNMPTGDGGDIITCGCSIVNTPTGDNTPVARVLLIRTSIIPVTLSGLPRLVLVKLSDHSNLNSIIEAVPVLLLPLTAFTARA
jgi:hypothetical protein